MQLFDTHPTPKLNVDFNSSETSCFAVSAKTPHAKQRDFKEGSWKKKTGSFFSRKQKVSAACNPYRFGEHEGAEPGSWLKDKAREVQYHTNKEYADAKWKSFGRTNHSTRRPVGSIPVRPASASVRHNTLREYQWDLSHLQFASIVRLDSSDVSASRSQRLISVWPTHVPPCHQHVVSQFHTWPMLLSFSVVSGHFQKTQHILRCRSPPAVSGFPYCTSSWRFVPFLLRWPRSRTVEFGPSTPKRLRSLRCTQTSDPGVPMWPSKFSLTPSLETLALSLCHCLCLCCCMGCSTCLSGNTWSAPSSTSP